MTRGPKSLWKEKTHSAGRRAPLRKEVWTGALRNGHGGRRSTPRGHWGKEQTERTRDSSEPHRTRFRTREGWKAKTAGCIQVQKQLRSVTKTPNWNDKKLHHPEIKDFQHCDEFFSGFYAYVYTKSFWKKRHFTGVNLRRQLNKGRWKMGERWGRREAPDMVAGRMGLLLTAKGTADLSRCKHSAENHRAGYRVMFQRHQQRRATWDPGAGRARERAWGEQERPKEPREAQTLGGSDKDSKWEKQRATGKPDQLYHRN